MNDKVNSTYDSWYNKMPPISKESIFNMLLKDYEIMRNEIRNCCSLYYKLALGFGLTGAVSFVYAINEYMTRLDDVAPSIVLGLFVPMLFVAQYALIIQYFFIYIMLFIYRILFIEHALSRLSGFEKLMNFETEFGRFYFSPGLASNKKDSPIRAQVVVHIIIGIVAALPSILGLSILLFCKHGKEQEMLSYIYSGLFVIGIGFNAYCLFPKKKKAEDAARKRYEEMKIEFDAHQWGRIGH